MAGNLAGLEPGGMKAMRWFRFYTEALDSAKVQRLPSKLFKVWVNLLCVGAEFDGSLPDVEQLSFRIRISEEDLRKHLDKLHEFGLVDIDSAGLMRLHDWDEWQRIGDDSAIRSKRYRDKKTRDASRDANCDKIPQTQTQTQTQIQIQNTEEITTPPTPSPASPPKKEPKEPTVLETQITEVAQRIHDRHPAIRRDIGVGAVTKRLSAIAKRIPPIERLAEIAAIDERHAAWCESADWLKDGGQFAKGLNNWLSPTMERWKEAPPAESTALVPLNGNGSGRHPPPITFAERNEQIRNETFRELMLDRMERNRAK